MILRYRAKNPVSAAQSPIWNQLDRCRRGIRKTGKGNKARYYKWDPSVAHGGEIEVYNARGDHIFVMDPLTGQWIKPARPGRNIKSELR